MSLENVESDPNVEVYKPPLEYVTHEEFTMQMERDANKKLKANLRKNRKLKKLKCEIIMIEGIDDACKPNIMSIDLDGNIIKL